LWLSALNLKVEASSFNSNGKGEQHASHYAGVISYHNRRGFDSGGFTGNRRAKA
jgi:hypothetical protein